MLIVCPNCNIQYDISENIILRSEQNLQCTNCLEIWKYTFPQIRENIAKKLINTNKSHPQITTEIQSILQEEAIFTKNLNKTNKKSTRNIKISKKDLQKLNLRIEANSSINKLSLNQKKEPLLNKKNKCYKKIFALCLIIVSCIALIGIGSYAFSSTISKYIPKTENALKTYKSKVIYMRSFIKNSF